MLKFFFLQLILFLAPKWVTLPGLVHNGISEFFDIPDALRYFQWQCCGSTRPILHQTNVQRSATDQVSGNIIASFGLFK